MVCHPDDVVTLIEAAISAAVPIVGLSTRSATMAPLTRTTSPSEAEQRPQPALGTRRGPRFDPTAGRGSSGPRTLSTDGR